MTGVHAPLAVRFRAKVAAGEPTECWAWQGAHNGRGYGQVKGDGPGRVYAHRLAYELAVGPIPQGMEVAHRCDNPPCVNPAHLFLATHAENMADMAGKGRGAGPGFVGEEHSQAKLTWPEVRLLRHMASFGTRHRDLGRLFGVNQTTVSRIVRGEGWREREES